jgi:hypothetical protein
MENLTERRTMIGISPSTRDRFNRIGAMLGAIEERKMSQDDTLVWLMDRYEREISRQWVLTAQKEPA